MPPLLFVETFGNGFVAVHLVDREQTPSSRFIGFETLPIVEIEILSWSHHSVASPDSSCPSAFDTTPRHHRSFGIRIIIEYLVPSDRTSSPGFQVSLNAFCEIGL